MSDPTGKLMETVVGKALEIAGTKAVQVVTEAALKEGFKMGKKMWEDFQKKKKEKGESAGGVDINHVLWGKELIAFEGSVMPEIDDKGEIKSLQIHVKKK